MLGANGRPIILQNVRYKVDIAALSAFAASEDAIAPVSSDTRQAKSSISARELIKRFLEFVDQRPDGEAYCNMNYTHSEIGQALIDNGYIASARLYPDRWPSCATQLGRKLRNIALGKYYIELDDNNAFHRLLHARTRNEKAKVLIERIVSDATLKAELASHYFGRCDSTVLEKIKKLLHAMSNEGLPRTWREENNIPPSVIEHPFVVDFAEAMTAVSEAVILDVLPQSLFRADSQRSKLRLSTKPHVRGS